ncbi:acetylglutamate kinase [Thermanaerothrix daxensis]|uniref:Putative [LysW]-aminoadipate kinase n=1 Tax=Thermanaerothrix daxensis TaxID=869279 RepID=A0A0P6XU52_9CHLR|nr:acetylglutamate kinase [Thermanaerothrix daxensis]
MFLGGGKRVNGNGHLQTLVVKLGGTEGVDFAAICQDVLALQREGWQMVLVHGGSAEANALGEALGHPPRFVTSPSGFTSRYTDRKTLEIFAAAVNGRVNTLLVEQLQALGINALGLCGLDGRLMVARRKDAIRIIENGRQKILRDDYTGTIETVNVGLLRLLLKEGYVPVVAPLALSPQGEALNVDADRAAAMIAAALQAATLVLLTGVPGLLRAFPDESTLIPRLTLAEMERALGYAEGRMKKKILGAQEALRGGVGRVIIADGRVGQPLVRALQGAGTWITP